MLPGGSRKRWALFSFQTETPPAGWVMDPGQEAMGYRITPETDGVQEQSTLLSVCRRRWPLGPSSPRLRLSSLGLLLAATYALLCACLS